MHFNDSLHDDMTRSYQHIELTDLRGEDFPTKAGAGTCISDEEPTSLDGKNKSRFDFNELEREAGGSAMVADSCMQESSNTMFELEGKAADVATNVDYKHACGDLIEMAGSLIFKKDVTSTGSVEDVKITAQLSKSASMEGGFAYPYEHGAYEIKLEIQDGGSEDTAGRVEIGNHTLVVENQTLLSKKPATHLVEEKLAKAKEPSGPETLQSQGRMSPISASSSEDLQEGEAIARFGSIGWG